MSHYSVQHNFFPDLGNMTGWRCQPKIFGNITWFARFDDERDPSLFAERWNAVQFLVKKVIYCFHFVTSSSFTFFENEVFNAFATSQFVCFEG